MSDPRIFDILAVLETEGNAVRLLGVYYNDPARAHEHASNVGGIVVVISPTVLGDYRAPQAPPLTPAPAGFHDYRERVSGPPRHVDGPGCTPLQLINPAQLCGEPLGGPVICAREPGHPGGHPTADPYREPDADAPRDPVELKERIAEDYAEEDE